MPNEAAAEFAAVCRQIRTQDPGCEMPIPCKFFPECVPTEGGSSSKKKKACRFAHVSETLRSEYHRLFKAVQEEDDENRRMDVDRAYFKREVFPFFALYPATGLSMCLSVTYSMYNEAFGTEHAYVPRGAAYATDQKAALIAYAETLERLSKGLCILSIRFVPFDADGETADGGHFVHRLFGLPPSVYRLMCDREKMNEASSRSPPPHNLTTNDQGGDERTADASVQ